MYQKLREVRLKNKYTSQQMADKLGISKSFYSQIETGSRRLTYNMAVRISSILTGFGFFDKVVSFCKCGLIIPTTGFAHAMTSAAMDHESEGPIKGIGSNIFKMTGSIILYGLVSAFFFALLKGVAM